MHEDPLRPEILLRVPSEMEGNMVLGRLQLAEIKATLTGSFTAGFRAEAPREVCVVVRSEDLEEAKKVLQLEETPATPQDGPISELAKPKDLLLLFSLVLILSIAGLWIVFL